MKLGIVKCVLMVLALLPASLNVRAVRGQALLPSVKPGISSVLAQSAEPAELDKLHDKIEKLYKAGEFEEAIPRSLKSYCKRKG